MSAGESTTEICREIAHILITKKWRLATCESCTGGQIASRCTDLAGSSQWFECGFVTYSNESKTALLGVTPAELSEFGAVSSEVAQAMVRGALSNAPCQVAIATTGVAGPGGGSKDKPVGLVWFSWGIKCGEVAEVRTQEKLFFGNREQIRQQAVHFSLAQLLKLLKS